MTAGVVTCDSCIREAAGRNQLHAVTQYDELSTAVYSCLTRPPPVTRWTPR